MKGKTSISTIHHVFSNITPNKALMFWSTKDNMTYNLISWHFLVFLIKTFRVQIFHPTIELHIYIYIYSWVQLRNLLVDILPPYQGKETKYVNVRLQWWCLIHFQIINMDVIACIHYMLTQTLKKKKIVHSIIFFTSHISYYLYKNK